MIYWHESLSATSRKEILHEARTFLTNNPKARSCDIMHVPPVYEQMAGIPQVRVHITRSDAFAALRKLERDRLMRDLGLVKVRGALGGTYWE